MKPLIKKTAPGIVIFLGLFHIVFMPGCTSRQRFRNYYWQMDSLHYYTAKIDSVQRSNAEQIAQLRIDFYTKTEELGEKMEMLNTRLSETEVQLTQISEKLGPGRKTTGETEDVSQLSPEARMLYESAYLNYIKGNYDTAITTFRDYLRVAGESPLADNALYWIGESYAAMGKRQDAVNTFTELITRYPESNKKPTALYKIGIIYEEARDLATARTYYERVISEFPNAPEANLAKSRLP